MKRSGDYDPEKYPKKKKVVKGIAEIRNYCTKQCLDTAKGELQTLQWLG